MSDRLEYPTSELGDLKEGLESLRREKEQVRAIVGAAGGKPAKGSRGKRGFSTAGSALRTSASRIIGERRTGLRPTPSSQILQPAP